MDSHTYTVEAAQRHPDERLGGRPLPTNDMPVRNRRLFSIVHLRYWYHTVRRMPLRPQEGKTSDWRGNSGHWSRVCKTRQISGVPTSQDCAVIRDPHQENGHVDLPHVPQ